MFDFKDYNIADWFSFYRIAAAPFLLAVLYFDARIVFATLLFISYSTDAIDGFLARKYNISSNRGARLDSMGDQITVMIGILGIFLFEFEFIKQYALPIILVLSLNILQQIIALIKYKRTTAFHTLLAKTGAAVEALFVIWLLFFGPVIWLFYVVIVIAILEACEEIALIFMYKNWVAGVKGIYWAKHDKRRD
ncbi:MAG: CDP-alcohol phosphatidyltransferase family protein [Gammaproteobacteria bacterium]|nr:CDP-alcohol phosphatidyltransferase family protein [Gammaproteobacteria bacterium]NNM12946.1 CDP-alcohol phosphatidyltransferase family protein [Gammaproteobacteria bacterium]